MTAVLWAGVYACVVMAGTLVAYAVYTHNHADDADVFTGPLASPIGVTADPDSGVLRYVYGEHDLYDVDVRCLERDYQMSHDDAVQYVSSIIDYHRASEDGPIILCDMDIDDPDQDDIIDALVYAGIDCPDSYLDYPRSWCSFCRGTANINGRIYAAFVWQSWMRDNDNDLYVAAPLFIYPAPADCD